jgi:hypothetical protein
VGLNGEMSMNEAENQPFDYDRFLSEVAKCRDRLEPSWVICRSVEHAEAFAYWCIENGIEEPEIAVVKI